MPRWKKRARRKIVLIELNEFFRKTMAGRRRNLDRQPNVHSFVEPATDRRRAEGGDGELA